MSKKVNPFIEFDLNPDEEIKQITKNNELTSDIQENKYYVSSQGRVFSTSRCNTKGKLKVLKTQLSDDGYIRVRLRTDDKENKGISMGRLVLGYFGDKESGFDGLEANHINYNTLNNYISNLNWMTPEENLEYSMDNHPTIITDEVLIDIFDRVNIKHEDIKSVAEMYNISPSSVRNAAHGTDIYKEKHKRLGLKYESKYKHIAHEKAYEIHNTIMSNKYTIDEIAFMYNISRTTVNEIKFCKNAFKYLITEFDIVPPESSRH